MTSKSPFKFAYLPLPLPLSQDLSTSQDRLVSAPIPDSEQGADFIFVTPEYSVSTAEAPNATKTRGSPEDHQQAFIHLSNISHSIVPPLDQAAVMTLSEKPANDSELESNKINAHKIYESTKNVQRWLQASLMRLEPDLCSSKNVNFGELNDLHRKLGLDAFNLPDLFGHLENTTTSVTELMEPLFDQIRTHEGSLLVPVDQEWIRSLAELGVQIDSLQAEINPLCLLMALAQVIENAEKRFIETATSLVAHSAALQRVIFCEQVGQFIHQQARRTIDAVTSSGASVLPGELQWLEVAMADPVSVPWSDPTQ